MDRIKIAVNNREERKKGELSKIRKEGGVPAVVYSNDINLTVTVPFKSMKALKSIHFSESAVIDVEIDGAKNIKTIPVFIKGIQFDPITEKVIHLDFLKVSLTKKIKVHVPVVLKGESKEIKEAEGTIEQVLRELEIEGLPLDIPEKIEVDISGLTIGHSLHVSDLQAPGDSKIITDVKATVVTAVAKEEEEPEPEVGVATGEGVEPEVIKEKKEAAGKEEGKEKASEQKEKGSDKKEKSSDQKK
jgi:large subunit ribosomal protein L25